MQLNLKFDVGDLFYIVSGGNVIEGEVESIKFEKVVTEGFSVKQSVYYYWGKGRNSIEENMHSSKEEAIQSWVDEQRLKDIR